MSLASRQRSCACCGKVIREEDLVSIEPLIDPIVRYVLVLWGHSTFAGKGDSR